MESKKALCTYSKWLGILVTFSCCCDQIHHNKQFNGEGSRYSDLQFKKIHSTIVTRKARGQNSKQFVTLYLYSGSKRVTGSGLCYKTSRLTSTAPPSTASFYLLKVSQPSNTEPPTRTSAQTHEPMGFQTTTLSGLFVLILIMFGDFRHSSSAAFYRSLVRRW